MKILVIGGTRFIGLAAVRRLAELGHTVAVFNRGKSQADLPPGVTRIVGDMNKLDEARAALVKFAPEVALHNVVLHDGQVRATQRVLRGTARRLVMTSSMDVYRHYGRLHGTEPGDPLPVPADEDAPLREVRYPYRARFPDPAHPLHNYDKIPAEQAALGDPDLPGTVVRLPMVFGPLDFQRRLLGFVRPMQDNRPALVLDESYAGWRSTYGYVDNMGHALALACVDDRATGRVYNAADGSYTSLELAEMVKAAMNWPGAIRLFPPDQLPEQLRAGFDTAHALICSAERIRRELGYSPLVSFEDGVRRTVAWEVEHPPEDLSQFQRQYAAEDQVMAGAAS